MLTLRKANVFTAGESKVDSLECPVDGIKFKIHKFTVRNKPDPKNVVIFPLFSEFGCETLACVYCLPNLLRKLAGKYTIVMGWHGREYLYRHLVDEFWEIPEDLMWLREYARAFHHVSKNLKKAEKEASNYGRVVDVSHISNIAVFPKLDICPYKSCSGVVINQNCQKCGTKFMEPGIFTRINEAKREACWLPDPSPEKMERARKYLPKNAVGITARHRKTWGRNLDPIFYERLVYLLEDMGYNPVWIGEKVTILPCPFKRIVDYSSSEDAKDLETTLALVKQMKFTVQFWTASSRLAGLMGTPFCIFESPDQLFGTAQEGQRLNLLTRGRKKVVVSHYRNCQGNHTGTLDLVREAVIGIEEGNFEDLIGLVEDKDHIRRMRNANLERIGEC